jgi:hypothetical protein
MQNRTFYVPSVPTSSLPILSFSRDAQWSYSSRMLLDSEIIAVRAKVFRGISLVWWAIYICRTVLSPSAAMV